MKKKKDEPFDIFSTNFMKRPFNLAYVTLECFSEIDLFCFFHPKLKMMNDFVKLTQSWHSFET